MICNVFRSYDIENHERKIDGLGYENAIQETCDTSSSFFKLTCFEHGVVHDNSSKNLTQRSKVNNILFKGIVVTMN